MSTIALYFNPWPEQGFRRGRGIVSMYRYAVWYKSNPRSAEYMHAVLAEHCPDAELVSTSEDSSWSDRVAQADKVVLLYPDAIGLGFSAVERVVYKRKKVWAGVSVLNGRRRSFRLNAISRLSLRIRRSLEWTMLFELLFLPVFLVATPLMWVIDLARGRA